MTGARQFASDMILPCITEPCRVLDVGAGDGWLTVALRERGSDVTAVDINPDRIAFGVHCLIADFTRSHHVVIGGPFDIICAVYCLQHLCDDEAVGWTNIRRNLAPTGRAFVVGRYRHAIGREQDRADPLNGHNLHGLRSLALATGLDVVRLVCAEYGDTHYRTIAETTTPNVFFAELRHL